MTSDAPETPPLTYRPRHRLTHARQYQQAFRSGSRRSAGPLTLFAIPNDLDHPRLGLSIGRRVGGAVERNRLKRRLREAFRAVQHDLPTSESGSFDLVITARAHAPLPLARYRELLLHLARRAAEPRRGGAPRA